MIEDAGEKLQQPIRLAKNTLSNLIEKLLAESKKPELENPVLLTEGEIIQLDKKIDPIVKRFPTTENIFVEALEKIKNESPNLLKLTYIKTNFSKCATILEQTAFALYLHYQKGMFFDAIEMWVSENESLLRKLHKKYPSPRDFAEKVSRCVYPLIQRLEFRAGQRRRARGGGTFEMIIRYLLGKLNIPCQKPKGTKFTKILKRIDIVVPDQETAVTRPDQALFLSCKRTLRERWKQSIPERKPSWRVFLLTVDKELSEDKANEIDSLGMIVYVRDELKSKPYLANKAWIRRLSSLPQDLPNTVRKSL